jgi:hypothetical protein
MTPDEISKLTKYFHRIFKQPEIQLRQRPQKDDSCEVYVSEEFIGVVFRDDEDPDDLSYNFSMAILELRSGVARQAICGSTAWHGAQHVSHGGTDVLFYASPLLQVASCKAQAKPYFAGQLDRALAQDRSQHRWFLVAAMHHLFSAGIGDIKHQVAVR